MNWLFVLAAIVLAVGGFAAGTIWGRRLGRAAAQAAYDELERLQRIVKP